MIRKILGWFLILVLVGASVALIEGRLYMSKTGGASGSGYGTGFFAHSFQWEANLKSSSGSSPQHLIVIEGYHPKTFMLTGHSSPDYGRIALTWNNRADSEWSHWVDVDKMMLIREEGNVALTPESLKNLMKLENATDQNLAILEEVIITIQSAKQGGLPPPNVDDYKFGQPVNGIIRHRARGSGYVLWHMTGAWAIVWSAFGLFSLFRIKRSGWYSCDLANKAS